MINLPFQEITFKNVGATRLGWWGNGRFTTTKNQRTNSRPNHCCFDTKHHLAMWKSRKIYRLPPLQAPQKLWQARSVNTRHYAAPEPCGREKRRVHRCSQAFGKKKYSEINATVTV
jgi:hypothetical protein